MKEVPIKDREQMMETQKEKAMMLQVALMKVGENQMMLTKATQRLNHSLEDGEIEYLDLTDDSRDRAL